MRSNRKIRWIGAALALTMTMSVAVESVAFAASYDLGLGDVVITANEQGQSVTHGGADMGQDDAPVVFQQDPSIATNNTVTLNGENGHTASVELSGVNIEGGNREAGITVNGDAEITVSGVNQVTGGAHGAGVEVNAGDSVTILGDGELTAAAGAVTKNEGTGAGIGGGNNQDGGSVTIQGDVTVTAEGNGNPQKSGTANVQGGSAGIGGGSNGSGGDVTITENADVTAIGGGIAANQYSDSYSAGGAGIGAGGGGANGGTVVIDGNAKVDAEGGYNAAGIGGAGTGNIQSAGGTVTIGGNAEVTAQGGYSGAGIGGGVRSDGGTVEINGAAQVTANGGKLAAGVGGGGGGYYGGSVVNNNRELQGGDGGSVTINGGTLNAAGGEGGAGVGGGAGAERAYLSGYAKQGLGGLGGVITVNGGTLNAVGGQGAVGVGTGSDSFWANGKVNASNASKYTTVWTASSLYAGELNIAGGNGSIRGGSAGLSAVADLVNTLRWQLSEDRFTVTATAEELSWRLNPVTPPTGPAAVPAPGPGVPAAGPETVTVADPEIPTAGTDEEANVPAEPVSGGILTVEDEQVPLMGARQGSWALTNLILAVGTALTALALLLGKGSKRGLRLASLIPGIGGAAAFLLTQSLTGRMVATDSWTLLMAAILTIQLGIALIAARPAAKTQEN